MSELQERDGCTVISVGRIDIRSGIRGTTMQCPVALALNRVNGGIHRVQCTVNEELIEKLESGNWVIVEIPFTEDDKRIRKFVFEFDHVGNYSPFEFYIKSK